MHLAPFLVSSVILILLLISFRIFTEVFGVSDTGGRILFVPLLIVVVVGPGWWKDLAEYRVPVKVRRWVHGGILLLLLAVIWLGYLLPSYDLPGGICSVVYQCSRRWEDTFRVELWSAVGNLQSQRMAAEFLFLLGVLATRGISLWRKKMWVNLPFPIGVVLFSVMVGGRPDWIWLLLLFVGVLVIFCMEGRQSISLKQFAGIVGGAFLLTGVTMVVLKPTTNDLYTIREEFLNIQTKLVQGVTGFGNGEENQDRKKISSKAPKYTYEEVLELTMNKVPANSVYLRGTHWGNYKNSTWEPETELGNICRQQGYNEQMVADRVLTVPVTASFCTEDNLVEYTIRYPKEVPAVPCYPYGLWSKGENIPMPAVSQEVYISQGVATNASVREDEAFYAWYNDYAKEYYLQVDDGLAEIKRLARVYKADIRFQQALNAITYRSENTGELNLARWKLAELIAEELQADSNYSLKPGDIMLGEDPVEGFLKNGKEGYCVHFASAGVLLLRELQVPARYVTGYLAKCSGMESRGQGYGVSVLDADAHAWLEIYLEDYGWIPVEMTPGYGSAADISEEKLQELQEQNQNSQSHEEEAEPSREQPEELPKENSPEPSVEEETTEVEEEPIRPEEPGEGKVLWVCLVLPLAVCMAGVYGFIVLSRRPKAVLAEHRMRKPKNMKIDRRVKKYIQQGQTRKAVLRMNQDIYQYLKKCNSAVKGKYKKLTDEEYFELLRESFPQDDCRVWADFAESVRRAAYSTEKVSEEEARLCYNIYHKLGKKFL